MFETHQCVDPLARTKATFKMSPQYQRLPDDMLCEAQPSQPALTNPRRWTGRIASALSSCFQVGALLIAVYAAVRLSLRHSDCTPRVELETNSFLPAYLRQAPRYPITFEDDMLFHGHSKSADDAWDTVMPAGRGHILVDNPRQYGLGMGKELDDTSEVIYPISGFHQMHCLGMIREAFFILSENASSVDIDAAVSGRPSLVRHVSHCFNYLRQAIMCAADPTVESLTDSREKDGSVRVDDQGWGTTHLCRNWDLLKEYAAAHAHSSVSGLGVKEYIALSLAS